MQGHPTERSDSYYMLEPQAQAEAGVVDDLEIKS